MKNLGIWNVIDDPATITAVGADLDFVIVDLEHGFRDFSRFSSTFLALKHLTSTMVRPRFFRDPWLQSLLDLGVTQFVVPQLGSLKDLEELLASLRYFPDGNRGVHPKVFLLNDEEHANNLEVVPIIETVEILENLDAVLNYSEVTGVYFGAYDLSKRLGLSSPSCKEMNEHLNRVIEIVNSYEKKFYCMPLNQDQRNLADMALYPNVVLGIDLEMLSKSIAELTKSN